ncbi:uncharacterized protein DMAD_05388 [Drosophila madeirensis]|uniref:Uncharacterized protein n=1 Tax=Drosophila madeirensis TaxID=30013 RepID=A0AAU9FMU4_DROMD|nr:uncharacterized protein LOC117893901 [Drosophila subobscura]
MLLQSLQPVGLLFVLLRLSPAQGAAKPQPNARNTGNCHYAKHANLELLCSGTVNIDTFLRWRDFRAPDGTPFTIWTDRTVFLVSFYRSDMWSYSRIKMSRQGKFMATNRNGKTVALIFPYGTVHCFKIGLRYLSDLQSSCMGEAYNPNEITAYPVIHYAHDRYKKRSLLSTARNRPQELMFVLLAMLQLLDLL